MKALVVVERCGAGEAQARAPRHVGQLDIDVVEDLQVVGHESDGADHHAMGLIRATQLTHHLAHVGAEPWFGCAARALPGHQPAGEAGGLGHQASRCLQLLGVGVAHGTDPLGQRMGGEDDRVPRAVGGRRECRQGLGDSAAIRATKPGSAYQGGTACKPALRPERGLGPLEVLSCEPMVDPCGVQHQADDVAPRRCANSRAASSMNGAVCWLRRRR